MRLSAIWHRSKWGRRRGDPSGKPGCSRRILSGRRTGGHHGRMPDAVEGSGTKKEGEGYGMDTGACSNSSSFRGGYSWACMCGRVQNQQMSVRLMTSGHHAGQGRFREKGADHDQTDRKRRTPEDA